MIAEQKKLVQCVANEEHQKMIDEKEKLVQNSKEWRDVDMAWKKWLIRRSQKEPCSACGTIWGCYL